MNYKNGVSFPKPLKTPKKASRSRLRVAGVSDNAKLKQLIQKALREGALIRDKGCVMRDFYEAGKCGGYRKDGELIYQFDHLNSRTHAISFGDIRLGIIVCLRHHFYYKKQYPAQYEYFARKNIGEKRCKLLDKVRADKTPYKVDLKLELIALTQEVEKLKKSAV